MQRIPIPMSDIAFSFGADEYESAGEIYSLPSGTYPLVISDATIAEIKSGDNQGKDQLRVEFTVDADGLSFTETIKGKPVTINANGRKLFKNLNTHTPQSRDIFIAFLKATGRKEFAKGFDPRKEHVELLKGVKMAGSVKRQPEPNEDYALADGNRNNLGRVFSQDSEQYKKAVATVQGRSGKDKLAP